MIDKKIKSNYSKISNDLINDEHISWEAKGIYIWMLSKPINWQFSAEAIKSATHLGRDTIRRIMKELQGSGYIEKTKQHIDGRYKYTYQVYAQKQATEKQSTEKQATEKQSTEKQATEKQSTENKSLYKESIKKESIKKESNTKKEGGGFTAPTYEDVNAYCLERKNNIDAHRFISYYESNGWMVGKNKMTDWKACIRGWETNEYSKAKPSAPTFTNNKEEEPTDYDAVFSQLFDTTEKASQDLEELKKWKDAKGL